MSSKRRQISAVLLFQSNQVFQTHKTFHSLMFKSGSMACNVGLEKTGFAPGEVINVNFAINNDSDVVINKVEVRLVV